MIGENIFIGTVIHHPARPDWGPGKVLDIHSGGQVVVYFRDLPEAKAHDAVKTISTLHVALEISEDQSDPLLDHLPLFDKGRFKGLRKPRLNMEQAVNGFLEKFPGGFSDALYIEEERGYKQEAHDQWESTLGDGQLRALVDSGDLAEIRKRVGAVENRLNLLAVYEKAGVADAFKDDGQALHYFSALTDLLDAGDPAQPEFVGLIAAVQELPQKDGGARVASWPVLTEYPFIARPEHHMLLKPELTKSCAARFNFDLCYSPELGWSTYRRLLKMSRMLLDHLKPYGARDFIDVQSFMFLIAKY